MTEKERELTICRIEAMLKEVKPETRKEWLEWCIENHPETEQFARLAVEMAAH